VPLDRAAVVERVAECCRQGYDHDRLRDHRRALGGGWGTTPTWSRRRRLG